MKKITIIGSTGMLGKPVTIELEKAGYELTLLCRNTIQAGFDFPSQKIIKGDIFNEDDLRRALQGQDAVYLNLSTAPDKRKHSMLTEREGIKNLIRIAQESGIGRIVFLSSLVKDYNNTNGFHWWLFDVKQAAVEMIKNSGIPYTIFYPSSFMENLDKLMLKGSRIMLAGNSRSPMYFIAAADYAKQVARSFQLLTDENREYAIQGKQAYTWDEAAAIFIQNYQGKHLKKVKAPLGMMKTLGYISPAMNYTYLILSALNNYPERFESEETWRELGEPQISLEEYAKSAAIG